MTSSPTPAPLRSSFDRLNASTYLHNPSSSPTSVSPQDPETIILFTWGAAPPKNIAKYTSEYISLYPSARILLLTSRFADLMFHTSTSQSAVLAPAVDLLRSTPAPRTLVHVWSNGGSYKLRELALAYKRKTGQKLPIGALVFDSAPGRPHWWTSIGAMKTVLPKPLPLKILGVVAIYLYIFGLFVWYTVLGRETITQSIWEALNDTELIERKAERLYITSKSDEMIWFEDVDAHAQVARERGCEVRMEEFVGSKHVAHPLVDKERYWRVLREHWQRHLAKEKLN